MGARSRPVHFKFEKVHLLAVAGGERSRVVDDRGEPLELARPAKGEVVWFDTKQPGLAVRVPATGAVRFMLYTWIGGKPVKRNLAPVVVDGWSVDRARLEAVKRKAAVEEGREDAPTAPTEELTAAAGAAPAPSGPTFRAIAGRYFRAYKGKLRTWRELVLAFRKHVKPHARVPVASVDAEWLRRIHARITSEGHPGAANRVLSLLSAILAHHLPEGAPNPARGVVRNPEHQRQRTFNDAELRALLRAIDQYESEPLGVSGNEGTDPAHWPAYRKPKEAAKLAELRKRWRENVHKRRERAAENRRTEADLLRLCLWTGQRAGNVRALKWSAVDLIGGTWRVSAKHFKNGDPHTAGLPDEALDILKRRKAKAEPGAVYVFPAGNDKSERGHFLAYHGAWARVKELAGIEETEEGTRLHDLRANLATRMAESGENAFVIQRALGHRSIRTTERYARPGTKAIQAAIQRTAGTIREAVKRGEEGVA